MCKDFTSENCTFCTLYKLKTVSSLTTCTLCSYSYCHGCLQKRSTQRNAPYIDDVGRCWMCLDSESWRQSRRVESFIPQQTHDDYFEQRSIQSHAEDIINRLLKK
jgi:hypothetical protein